MKRTTTMLKLAVLILLIPTITKAAIIKTPWITFDNIPTNLPTEIPKDATAGSPVEWKYSSVDHNTGRDFFGSAGWFNPDPNQTTVDEEAINMAGVNGTYNDPHMGYVTFGYLDISDKCVVGNCMKYTVTGGFSKASDGQDHCGSYGSGGSCQQYGDLYKSKTGYLALGSDPTYDGSLGNYQIGHFKWYLGNGDMSYHTPLPVTTTAHNRMSYYFYLPGDATPMQNVIDGIPATSLSYAAPFNSVGGHWYHNGLNHVPNGWTHYYIDEHPSYNNSWGSMVNSPLPLGAMRTFRTQYPSEGGYWEKMYHFYHSSVNINTPIEQNGLALPNNLPASAYTDEINFVEDPEPQNEETIQGVSLTYIYDTQYFWIGFSGKYKHACNINYASYEIRYRIGSEITNANFDSSNLVDITVVPEFTGLKSPAEGVIAKDVSCRSGVLVRFKVKPQDQHLITEGASLWVAIKDVSQDPNDDHLPNPSTGYEGRNYTTHTDLDYAYDSPAMQLIKRIPYTLGPDMNSSSTEIRADVDQNSTVNSTDAMLTLRNSLGLDMSSTNWVTGTHTGDVNCDNSSNSTDAMLILRKSLDLDMTGTGWCAG